MINYEILIHNLLSCKTDVESIRNISLTLATYIYCIQNFLKETREKLPHPKEDQYKTLLNDLNEVFYKFSNFLQDLSQKKERLLHLTQTIDARHDDMLKTLSCFCFSKDELKSSMQLNTSNDTKDFNDHEINTLFELYENDLEEKQNFVRCTLVSNEGNEIVVDKNCQFQEEGECLDTGSASSNSKDIHNYFPVGDVKVEATEEYSQHSKEETRTFSTVGVIKVEPIEEHFNEQLVSHKGVRDCFQGQTKQKQDSHQNHRKGTNVCSICGRSFASKSSLNRHSHLHSVVNHSKTYTEGKNVCPICGRSFASKSSLNRHSHLHSGRITRNYACELCGKLFSRRDHVKRHMFLHTPERKLPCHICNKIFKRPNNLTAHLKTHRGMEFKYLSKTVAE